jgi:pimeloyl-ACP methyl ester carboxylesterase
MAHAPIAPPGRLIDIGTHRLHIHCLGSGLPAVIFDAALGGSSLSWMIVQPEVAAFTTACSYDRAGFGWSEGGPMPRTAGRIVGELHTLLMAAKIPPPYVLVGHSFGGLTIRVFAARHPELVAGLVFVDPAHPEDWVEPSVPERARIARGTRLCRHGAVAAHMGITSVISALVSAGALNVARRVAAAVSRGGLQPQDEAFLAPAAKLPRDVRPMLKWMWTQPRFFEALGSQIECVSASAAEVPFDPDYTNVPLIAISASNTSERRRGSQEALARRSARGRHIVASNSGHWVPLDEPQTVVAAIRDVVQAVRIGAR